MLKIQAPKAAGGTTGKARRLRREMSLPEVLLWRCLRGSPMGIKFRRQHPTGIYVLDFYCNDARLVIEIDGKSHDMGDRPDRDDARDLWLKQSGMETIRIPASDVLKDAGIVAEAIVSLAKSRLPLHHPAGGPPPRDKLGEDF